MLKKYLEFIKESKTNYTNKNLIEEICISMVLLNNQFLDNLLDKGLKARYSEDSQVFLNDLKSLVQSKNRLSLGKFYDGKCIKDEDLSKLNGVFETLEFDIEKDWKKLIDARTTARNIIDKLLGDEKLDEKQIRMIYWLGPNKTEENKEDIIIETTLGKQYSLFLNKNLQTQKTSSFNTFAEEFIEADLENLYGPDNIKKWDRLAQAFIEITYESANKNIQTHIEKFIDTKRIDSIGYFEYFNIRHRDPRFKYLGELMPEFDKNILYLNDLLKLVWKEPEKYLNDPERAIKEWTDMKIVVLNSKILENLFTTSLIKNKKEEIEKIDDVWKRSSGTLKMKLIKILVEKLGCEERPLYYLSKSGNDFFRIPSRTFFRKYYDDIDVDFDYHVKFKRYEEADHNDFNMKVKISFKEDEIMQFTVSVKFQGGEFSDKLSAKYKFDIPDNFNYKLSKIEQDKEDQ